MPFRVTPPRAVRAAAPRPRVAYRVCVVGLSSFQIVRTRRLPHPRARAYRCPASLSRAAASYASLDDAARAALWPTQRELGPYSHPPRDAAAHALTWELLLNHIEVRGGDVVVTWRLHGAAAPPHRGAAHRASSRFNARARRTRRRRRIDRSPPCARRATRVTGGTAPLPPPRATAVSRRALRQRRGVGGPPRGRASGRRGARAFERCRRVRRVSPLAPPCVTFELCRHACEGSRHLHRQA